MEKLSIKGGKPLYGEIYISGSKNSALPIMAASLLTEDTLVLSNVPFLVDVTTMSKLLVQHGVDFCVDGSSFENNCSGKRILFNAANVNNLQAPYEIVRKMRASVIVLGPLLARFGRAKVSLPGGCAIGTRPVDLHIKGLEAMGAKIELEEGYICAEAPNGLHGAEITFDKVSVGATENVMMAATLANGITIINNAAKEPEIIDLGNCLKAMGADIEGLGSDKIVIKGINKLKGANYRVISDRIEAGSFAAMVGATGGEIKLQNFNIDLFHNVLDKFEEIGVNIVPEKDGILVKRKEERLKAAEIITQPHPGFPTDLQAQFMAMTTIAEGVSTIQENIFENRFMHVPELIRMGANIKLNGNMALIKGVERLKGAQVMATDLRASMSLLIAALSTDEETIVNRIYHIDRGYERIEEKLQKCGAVIQRLK
ncbi:MAG: UDP-N-acetylglucosamine 1-carboxyvinyltransferase [Sphingobacteriia bacterium]|nr:UDP-N-acetylglucosamine 1-carboxyvinyltransferase [Sphingobacteriia bacterium]